MRPLGPFRKISRRFNDNGYYAETLECGHRVFFACRWQEGMPEVFKKRRCRTCLDERRIEVPKDNSEI